MEETYKEALMGARIVDLQDNSFLALPDTEELVDLGLTVDDRLSFAIDGFYDDDDDLVLTLCQVQREEDGHWLLPSAFIPCVLNEANVEEKSLLSPGSIIKVGDREMRYSLPIESRLKLSAESKGLDTPPPKPRRTSLNVDQPLDQSGLMTPIKEEDEECHTNKPETRAIEPEADADLIQHLATSEDVAQLACSYVSHQVALYTDLLLSTEELDFMFKAIQSCSESNISHMHKFVRMYNREQVKAEMEVWPLHGPVIYLLTQLLNSTLDSGEMATLWIKLLATFANFSPNLPSFIQHKVAPVVMGAMAVHTFVTHLQQYAATVLSQLATFSPPIGQKGPVREAGVDLVMHASKTHTHETLVLRPALRTLANLTQTYSNLADEALSVGAFQIGDEEIESTSTVVLQEVERSMGILDYIEENALPVVMETMENNIRDVAIQTEGRRLLAFFVDDGHKTNRKKSVSKMSQRKVRFQLDPLDPNSIVSTDSIVMDAAPGDFDEFPPIKPLRVENIGDNNDVSNDDEKSLSNPECSGTMSDENLIGETNHSGLSAFDSGDNLKGRRKVIGFGIDLSDIKSELEVTCADENEFSDFGLRVIEEVQEPDQSKSLMDEFAEVQADIVEDDETSIPKQSNSLLDEITETQAYITENDYSLPEKEVTNTRGKNDEPFVDTLAIESVDVDTNRAPKTLHEEQSYTGDNKTDATQSTQELPEQINSKPKEEEQRKTNSLKRGVAKMLMTGRAMDKAFKSGKNRMLTKMKKGLRFRDLRRKENDMVSEHKVNSDGSDPPSTVTEIEEDYQNETDEILSSLILAGVTIGSSSTDNSEDQPHIESQNTESIESESSEIGRKLAPPLFVPQNDPKVIGSQNTVNKLINLWKHKETSPKNEQCSSESEGPRPPPRKNRNQWRPFEIDENEPFEIDTNQEKTKQQNKSDCDSAVCSESPDHRLSGNDDILREEDVKMAKRVNRGPRGSLASIPQVGRLMTAARPSLTDSMELATWASSYLSVRGQDIDDIDPELEQEVRLNKTRWKSVVAEMKDRIRLDDLPVNLKPPYISENLDHEVEDVFLDLTSSQSSLQKGPTPRKYKPRPVIRKSVTTYPTTDLNQERYHQLNLLAAKYLMVQAILKTWHLSPSLAASMLETPSGELLISAGASPSLVSDVRHDIHLDKPISEIYQVLATKVMAILTSIPSANEIRLELIGEILQLLKPNGHLYHVQVGTESILCLLNHNVQETKTTSDSRDTNVLEELNNRLTQLKCDDSPLIKDNIIKIHCILDFLLDESDTSAIFV